MPKNDPTNVGFRVTEQEKAMFAYLKKNTDAKTNSQVLRRSLYEFYDNIKRKKRQSANEQE